MNMSHDENRISVIIDSEFPVTMCEESVETKSEISISSEEEAGSGSDSDQRVRARPVQEIWEPEAVWSSLLFLEEAERVIDFIKHQNFKQLILNDVVKRTGLIISCWMGNSVILKFLLENGASIHVTDRDGRTPLHLAACSGSLECLKLLVNAGASPTAWDNLHKATPIHCTSSEGNLSCTRFLIKSGADVNSGITNKSPLHYAVQSLAVDCVKELLEAGAIPNTPQVFSEAPIHVAAALGSAEIVRLLIKHGACVAVQCGPERTSALHLAAEDGDPESTRLLIDAGASVMSLNRRLQTPLHMATLSQSTETLQLLLNRGADPNAVDADGRTPLHGAIAKASRCECVRLLLNAGANVNKPDSFGYTPLHIAALNEFSQFVMMLINYGGDVTARTNGGISVLTFITRRTPDVIPKYITKFDTAIKLTDHELGDVDCELKLDFRVLVPVGTKGETELLLNFIEVGHREILKHPLCETFLFLKWRRIRKFFFFSLVYHALLVFLFTAYTIGVFLRDCPVVTRTVLDNCAVALPVRYVGYLLIFFNVLMVCKEVFQIAHNWAKYIKHWENWLQWLIIVSVFLCVYPSSTLDVRSHITSWQHHVAAVGIFVAWLELMMIVGRFPVFGLYVQMFQTVSINFIKFLLAYACLLIAFSLCFGVLLANYPPYSNLMWGLLKTIAMMSGELEFEDMFYDPDYPILYPITTQIMFFLFILLVTMIVGNLMVGLAVSDIQGLQQSAGLDRLVRQAELVAQLESMLFSRLLKHAPKAFLRFFYKHALLLKSHHHWALYVRPNDPREERIPKELVKSIYYLVAEQKDKIRAKSRRSKRKSKSRCSGRSFTVIPSPTISRLNSNMSSNISNAYQPDNHLKDDIEQLHKDYQDWNKVFMLKLEQLIQKVNSPQN